jgi:hypothetical protein
LCQLLQCVDIQYVPDALHKQVAEPWHLLEHGRRSGLTLQSRIQRGAAGPNVLLGQRWQTLGNRGKCLQRLLVPF